jgi:hypothetical protein
MELDDETSAKVKKVYDKYYASEITSEEAMYQLELIINEVENEDE